MGLTIHYGLRLKSNSRKNALSKLRKLHNFAKTLPFAELGKVVSFRGDDADFDRSAADDDHSWFKLQASEYISDKQSGNVCRLPASEIIGFKAWPGEGCEESNFGLCRYPKILYVADREIPTRMGTGWRWSSFCKTQYASNVNTAHFLRCHIMVIKMLDIAKELGFIIDVSDEGDYWEKRDAAALAEEVGEWNTMIAGQVGKLSDLFGGDIVAPIKDRGDFEHLEAKAQKKP